MEQEIEVVYRNGVLMPLEPLSLSENQRAKITLLVPLDETPEDILAAWQQVYVGLSDKEMMEIERITRDRDHFMPERD